MRAGTDVKVVILDDAVAGHFPIQNLPKIFPRISSVVTSPVMVPR
jgi:hypothetical protein